ncbi:PD-(D/E)XK nuclease family protein [Gramella sp. GC03-9]|uniref:PD-(D/E)XK nuclease family protein n=1 Tax=Christiangramia oceanisediminis TaxID=2920386 RepID=A0A9X2I3L6_9FLAO|nr:PD-(D/E)XK nuclease family protein [Gramella oceanisediminis]MCP9199210.1 PD-(D/E)XK nuclease family protein [Gramella oceanisediminis]
MESFIHEVLKKLDKSSTPLSEIIFILPSKRAGSFLLKELSTITEKAIFAPTIYSIEQFTEEVSGLETIDNITSLFEFFEVYRQTTPKDDLENFDSFLNWGQSLIHDFNEIDRYLIDHHSFFNYLSEIQDINHWYLKEEKTELIKRYLKFWKSLPKYYEALKDSLLKSGRGYQGLIYRRAAETIQRYSNITSKKHVFIGFNALNAAEQLIMQKLLETNVAEVFWDLDQHFYQDPDHAASIFIRQYLKEWDYYKKQPVTISSQHYSEEKEIDIVGIPKNVGQAKYLGEILTGMQPDQLKNTAIILGEEDLLLPVLNSIPEEIGELNITMGFPVKNAPVNSLFENLFHIHRIQSENYYYKDVIAILESPSLQSYLGKSANEFLNRIQKENLVYLSASLIIDSFPDELKDTVSACFSPKNNSVKQFLDDIQKIIQKIKIQQNNENNQIGLEFLFHFHTLFNQLENLSEKYEHIQNIDSLYRFYNELMSTQKLDFQGKPFTGLQLMGMLESRAIDFETVIITSLNEGVLPAGKSDNSFIPYDLKQEYKLPTYREKDAVYTYHFYRLLQRAKKVYLLHNTEVDGLNSGEKSRFLTQLEIEKMSRHKMKKYLISPNVPGIKQQLRQVKKTPLIMERIKSLANSGFSPSALTTYIRNPMDFYQQYVLGIRDREEVEETVAFNTLGTVVHNCLENLYRPLEGKTLTKDIIGSFLKRADEQVTKEFQDAYSKIPLKQGKNLLIFEVAKRYVFNFLQFELKRLNEQEEVQILEIEKEYKAQLYMEKLPYSVYLRGKIDRFELANGIPRIVDYKTGKVESKDLKLDDWEEITKDYDKYSKSFQVLTYASLIALEKGLTFPAEAGIISFKNMRSGFLAFEMKNSKQKLISQDILEHFQEELKALILEICDPEIAFVEKDIKKNYGGF